MASDWTSFKTVSDYFDTQFTDELATNIISFTDFAFLGIGAYTNVQLQSSGYYGGDPSLLRYVADPYYPSGSVWEGFRSNWVYESGVPYNFQPISISGCYVNGVLVPNVSGGAVSVNYTQGRFIFDPPINVRSTVNAEYSYKYINVSNENTPWARSIMANSLRVDNPQLQQGASGIWGVLSQSRIQLPAIIVQATNRIRLAGYELGGGYYRYQDILFHVLSEQSWDRNAISDILVDQLDKRFFIFNVNKMAQSGLFPLDYNGYRVPNSYLYPDMVDPNNGFRDRGCIIKETSCENYEDARGIYRSVVRWTCELTHA